MSAIMLILCSWLCSMMALLADSEVQQFARSVIESNINIDASELEFSEWQQSISGGYVLKFIFDADGDGSPERFYASSLNSDELLYRWVMYSGQPVAKAGGEVISRPEGFWWNPKKHEILTYASLGAEGGSAFISRITHGSIVVQEENVSFNETNVGLEAKASPREGFTLVRPEISISLLADVVERKDPVWRNLVLDEAGENYELPNGRLLLTADSSRMAELQKFTPKVAFEALIKLGARNGEGQEKVANGFAADGSTLSQNIREVSGGRTTESHTGDSPFFFWGIMVLLFIAILGFTWRFANKRR